MEQLAPQIMANAQAAGQAGAAFSDDLIYALTQSNERLREMGTGALAAYVAGAAQSAGYAGPEMANLSNTLALQLRSGQITEAWATAGALGVQSMVTAINNQILTLAIPNINWATGQIPANIAASLTSGIPAIQAGAVQMLAPVIQQLALAATEGPEEAANLVSSLTSALSTGNYAPTGNAAGDEFLLAFAQATGQPGPIQQALEASAAAAQVDNIGTKKGLSLTNAMAAGVKAQAGQVKKEIQAAADVKIPRKTVYVDVRPGEITRVNVPVAFRSSPPLPLEPFLAHVNERFSAVLGAGVQMNVGVGFGGGVGYSNPLQGYVDGLTAAWEQAMTAFGNFKADMDAAPFREVEEAIMAVTAGNYSSLEDWRNLRTAYDNAKTALKGYTDQIEAAQSRISDLQRKQEDLNKSIQNHEAALSRLSQMKMTGEGAVSDKSFGLSHEIHKLELGILKAKQEGRYADAAAMALEKKKLEKEKEIVDLQGMVDHEVQRRQLEKLLDPLKGQEMSYRQISLRIRQQQNALFLKRKSLERIQDQIDVERDKVYELQKAWEATSKQVQSFEEQIDKLARWFVQKMQEMQRAASGVGEALAGSVAGAGAVAAAGNVNSVSTSTTTVINQHFDQLVLPNVKDYAGLKRDLGRDLKLRNAMP